MNKNLEELKTIFIYNIYFKYCKILKNISKNYNLNYQILHDDYLSEFVKNIDLNLI